MLVLVRITTKTTLLTGCWFYFFFGCMVMVKFATKRRKTMNQQMVLKIGGVVVDPQPVKVESNIQEN